MTNGELGVFVKQAMFEVRYKILLGALGNYVGLVSNTVTIRCCLLTKFPSMTGHPLLLEQSTYS